MTQIQIRYLSAQFVCPSPKNLDFNEKRHWVFVVREVVHSISAQTRQEGLEFKEQLSKVLLSKYIYCAFFTTFLTMCCPKTYLSKYPSNFVTFFGNQCGLEQHSLNWHWN